MKKLFAIILMCVSAGAFAGGIQSDAVGSAGFSKLTEAEKAEVLHTIAQKAAEKNAAPLTNADNVEKWVKIGSNIGQGLAGAAKEVGVAVNDFSKTPVGQLTTMLIIWHMIGQDIMHIVGGILVWLCGFSILWFMIRQAYPPKVTYSNEKKNIFGNAAIQSVEKMAIVDSNAAGWLFAFGIVLLAGLGTMFWF